MQPVAPTSWGPRKTPGWGCNWPGWTEVQKTLGSLWRRWTAFLLSTMFRKATPIWGNQEAALDKLKLETTLAPLLGCLG